MQALKKRTVASVLLLLLLSAGFAALLVRIVRLDEAERAAQRNRELAEALSRTVVETETQVQSNVDDYYESKLWPNVELMSCALEQVIRSDALKEPLLLEDGMLIRVRNGKLILPSGASGDIPDLPDGFLHAESHFFYTTLHSSAGKDPGEVAVVWDNVCDDWYYLDWTSREELEAYVYAREDEAGVYDGAGNAFDGILVTLGHEDGELIFLYAPDALDEYETPAEAGITPEKLKDGSGQLDIGGQVYDFVAKDVKDSSGSDAASLLFLTKQTGTAESGIQVSKAALAAMLLLIIPLLVWLASLQRSALSERLNEEAVQPFRPSVVRRTVAVLGVVTALVIFLFMAFYGALRNLYTEASWNLNVAEAVSEALSKREDDRSFIEREEAEWVEYYGRRLGWLMNQYPQLQTKENLDLFNDIVGGERITLYNGDGRQLLSSGPYEGFVLSEDPADASCDFRRLLKGVALITHDVTRDETTGIWCRQIGSCVRLAEGGYGALILSVKEDQTPESDLAGQKNALVRRLTRPGSLCLIYNRESGLIEAASSEKYLTEPERFGLHPSASALSGVDFFRLDGSRWYGIFTEQTPRVIYYLSDVSTVTDGILKLSLCATALFCVLYGAISLCMLSGYNDTCFEAARGALNGQTPTPMEEAELSEAMLRRRRDSFASRHGIGIPWHARTPAGKASFTLRLLLALLLVPGVLLYDSASSAARLPLIHYLFNGEWTHGFNLFALSSIVLLAVCTGLAILFLRFALGILGTAAGPMGETVCRLLVNVLEYAAAIFFLVRSFTFLGISTEPLIGAIGILSLAFSLGSQSLVADVLAGITIVLEREYQVGDVVEINGFKGIVESIGVRSTRLVGLGDNVKIIGNRNVNEVLNLTKMNSWLPLELRIPGNQPLKEIEDMLIRELPKLEGTIDGVISGPYYKGILNLGEGGYLGGANAATLSVIAEYREENYLKVRRNLNHALKELFLREGYSYY